MPTNPVTSGLQCEYDVQTLSLSDGTTATALSDISGNANNLSVPSGFVGPVFKTNILNGRPVLRFNSGATNHCLSVALAGWATGNAGYTFMMLVASGAAGASLGRWISVASASGYDYYYAGGGSFEDSGGTLIVESDAADSASTLSNIRRPTTFAVVGMSRSATQRTLIANGFEVAIDITAHALGVPTQFALGQIILNVVSTGNSGSFDLCALAAWNRDLLPAEKVAAAAYLLQRYGAVSTPVVASGGLNGGLQ